MKALAVGLSVLIMQEPLTVTAFNCVNGADEVQSQHSTYAEALAECTALQVLDPLGVYLVVEVEILIGEGE